MTLLSGPVVLGYGQIVVLPEVAAKAHNQILEKNILKALDKKNQITNFYVNRKERKYSYSTGWAKKLCSEKKCATCRAISAIEILKL